MSRLHPIPRPSSRGSVCGLFFSCMSKITSKIKEEIIEMIPPTLFFFVALHIVALIRSLMLKGTGIAVGTFWSVTIAALVLGKAVLIADMLPFINRYPEKPLIYNIAWKTALYLLVSLVVHYLEHLIDFWRETGGLVAGNRKLLSEIVWPHFVAIQILLAVMIFSYCSIRELARVLGRRRIVEIFFLSPSASSTSAERGDGGESDERTPFNHGSMEGKS
jgi:hypothetical protein